MFDRFQNSMAACTPCVAGRLTTLATLGCRALTQAPESARGSQCSHSLSFASLARCSTEAAAQHRSAIAAEQAAVA